MSNKGDPRLKRFEQDKQKLQKLLAKVPSLEMHFRQACEEAVQILKQPNPPQRVKDNGYKQVLNAFTRRFFHFGKLMQLLDQYPGFKNTIEINNDKIVKLGLVVHANMLSFAELPLTEQPRDQIDVKIWGQALFHITPMVQFDPIAFDWVGQAIFALGEDSDDGRFIKQVPYTSFPGDFPANFSYTMNKLAADISRPLPESEAGYSSFLWLKSFSPKGRSVVYTMLAIAMMQQGGLTILDLLEGYQNQMSNLDEQDPLYDLYFEIFDWYYRFVTGSRILQLSQDSFLGDISAGVKMESSITVAGPGQFVLNVYKQGFGKTTEFDDISVQVPRVDLVLVQFQAHEEGEFEIINHTFLGESPSSEVSEYLTELLKQELIKRLQQQQDDEAAVVVPAQDANNSQHVPAIPKKWLQANTEYLRSDQVEPAPESDRFQQIMIPEDINYEEWPDSLRELVRRHNVDPKNWHMRGIILKKLVSTRTYFEIRPLSPRDPNRVILRKVDIDGQTRLVLVAGFTNKDEASTFIGSLGGQ